MKWSVMNVWVTVGWKLHEVRYVTGLEGEKMDWVHLIHMADDCRIFNVIYVFHY